MRDIENIHIYRQIRARWLTQSACLALQPQSVLVLSTVNSANASKAAVAITMKSSFRFFMGASLSTKAREKGMTSCFRKTTVTNTPNDNERHSFQLYFNTYSGKNQVPLLHNRVFSQRRNKMPSPPVRQAPGRKSAGKLEGRAEG